jgi:hypothetical protein
MASQTESEAYDKWLMNIPRDTYPDLADAFAAGWVAAWVAVSDYMAGKAIEETKLEQPS